MIWRQLTKRFLLIPSKCHYSISLYFTQTSKLPTMCKDEVIVVTGGSGFLGQHIVHLLQTQENSIKEIRIFDVKPYKKFLDHDDVKPVREIIGDICDPYEMKNALRGADAVIHIAGLVSFSTFPQFDEMNRINISGTKNVVTTCIEENVQRLIFCSTVDVVIGFDDIVNGTEETTTTPSKFLFPGYPESKHKAEQLVIRSNGTYLTNGQKLHTISLRPNVMYGEGDPFMITAALKSAKETFGWVIRVGDGSALFQKTYAGNVAWAFLKANEALRLNPDSVGGHFFFIPDETPIQNIFDSLHPYLVEHNFKVSPFRIPYSLIYILFTVRDIFLWVISFFAKFHLTPLCSISYINMTLVFSGKKAQRMLGYHPLFTPAESIKRSKKFYDSLKLK